MLTHFVAHVFLNVKIDLNQFLSGSKKVDPFRQLILTLSSQAMEAAQEDSEQKQSNFKQQAYTHKIASTSVSTEPSCAYCMYCIPACSMNACS